MKKYIFKRAIHKYKISIDFEQIQFVCVPPAEGLAEGLLKKLNRPYYNPLLNYQFISKRKATKIIQTFKLDSEWSSFSKSWKTMSVQMILSTYNYILNHESPVVLWPELGMHIEQQQAFYDSLKNANITKGIFITDSIFIPGGQDDLLIGFDCVE